MSEEIIELIESLEMIEQDLGIPKNVKCKIRNAILALQDTSIELSVKANKALQELDEISDDPNIPPYVRPQIWNIVSLLAGL
ncbi:hypothetical protein D6777_01605 [Candidatus Woesearchaeota archaeon]|nr:MAG: hypothetical protein D6777_01605 [Candidatus Woesearchaeota archaeon]